MFGRLLLTFAITLQSIVPAYAADEQFFFRTAKSGIITYQAGTPTDPSTATPDIADQSSIVFGTVGTIISKWGPRPAVGWPSAVVDASTRATWNLAGTTYSANYDLSRFGLSFDSGSGAITGTLAEPFTIADFAITVTANGRSDTTAPFSISALAANSSDLTVSALSPVHLTGNVVYDGSTTIRKPTVAGLVGNPSWFVGDIPAGLAYNPSTGILSGKVTDSSQQGQHDIPLTVYDDSNGNVASGSLSIDIRPPFRPLDYTGGPLQEGFSNPLSGFNIREVPSNRAYDSHGLTWSLVSGSIPTGITTTVDGELFTFSGVPSVSGDFTSIWKVTDASGWSLTLNPITFTVVAGDALAVNGIPATSAVGNRTYTASAPVVKATVNNLAGTPTWSATGLPTGLTINPTNGAVTGTVSDGTLQGDHDVTITVVDSGNAKTASMQFTLTMTAPFTYFDYAGATLTQQVPMAAGGFNLREIGPDGNLTVAYENKGVVASLVSGHLPTGIKTAIVDEFLLFSGVPEAAGTFSSTWKVTDANGWSLTFPEITMKVNAREELAVVMNDAISARGEQVYTEASPARGASARGVIGTATWSATGLPSGLSISSTGNIVGTVSNPSLVGDYDVTVTLTDSADGATASKSVDFTVSSALSLLSIPYTGSTLTKDVVIPRQGFNIRLPGNFQAVNRGLSVSLVSGSLPPGMTLAPRTAASELLDFNGAPTALGTYTSVWKVTDMYGWELTTNSVTFTVNPRTVAFVASLASPIFARGEKVYDAASPLKTAGVSGLLGTATWSATGLPDGLTIDPSTGAIVGTITSSSQVGDYDITVTVDDSVDGATSSKNAVITVESALSLFSIPYTGGSLTKDVPVPTQGFNIRLPGNYTAVNRGLTVSLVSGSLPPGVTLAPRTPSSYLLDFTGTPTVLGTYSSVWKVTDMYGWELTTNEVTFIVAPRAATLASSVPASASAVGGTAYTTTTPALTATASGIIGTASWTATGLPTGLTMGATTGKITGTVSNGSLAGTYNVTVTVTDSADGVSVSKTTTLTVASPMTVSGTYSGATVTKGLAVTAQGFSVRYASNNAAYTNKGLSVSLVSGSIPPGMAFAPATATSEALNFTGTPNTLGTYTSVWKVTDSSGWTLTLPSVTFQVNARSNPLNVGITASFSLRGEATFTEAAPLKTATVTNLIGAATWSATGLPAGLSISPSTGNIIGSVTSPSAVGTYNPTITVTDSADGATGSKAAVITVTSAIYLFSIPYTGGTLTKDVAMTPQGFNIRTTGNYAATNRGLTVSLVSGSLPPGVAFAPRTATSNNLDFTGTPTATGTYTSVWKVTDMYGWTLETNAATFVVN